MIFSSYEFLITLSFGLAGYGILRWLALAQGWPRLITWYLAGLSLYFYAQWGWRDVGVILLSIGGNFAVGALLTRSDLKVKSRQWLVRLGVTFNVGLLVYFKYTNFMLDTVAAFMPIDAHWEVFLPLGISFFTFQQIGYIVDCGRGQVARYRFVDYLGFVTFFPQLIAGPIVSHRRLVPQFQSDLATQFSWLGMGRGLALFSIGLGKKVILADQLAPLVSAGYESAATLSMPEAWIVTLAYTCQLYFDFSGYSDMAVGLGLFFGIRLPMNFDSPLRAPNIQLLWARWNITLGKFFRDYLFRAWGGFSRSSTKQSWALFGSMVLIGLWHSATWMMVLFGAIHGVGLLGHRRWRRMGLSLPAWLGSMVTFLFIHFTLILFRSSTMGEAMSMLQAVLGGDLTWPASLQSLLGGWDGVRYIDWLASFHGPKEALFALLVVSLGIIWFGPNTQNILTLKTLDWRLWIGTVIVFVAAVMLIQENKEFIYFVF